MEETEYYLNGKKVNPKIGCCNEKCSNKNCGPGEIFISKEPIDLTRYDIEELKVILRDKQNQNDLLREELNKIRSSMKSEKTLVVKPWYKRIYLYIKNKIK